MKVWEKKFFSTQIYLIPDKKLSIHEGAIQPWKKGINNYYYRVLRKIMEYTDLDLDIPFEKNKKKDLEILLFGSENILIEERRFSRFGKRKIYTFQRDN